MHTAVSLDTSCAVMAWPQDRLKVVLQAKPSAASFQGTAAALAKGSDCAVTAVHFGSFHPLR